MYQSTTVCKIALEFNNAWTWINNVWISLWVQEIYGNPRNKHLIDDMGIQQWKPNALPILKSIFGNLLG